MMVFKHDNGFVMCSLIGLSLFAVQTKQAARSHIQQPTANMAADVGLIYVRTATRLFAGDEDLLVVFTQSATIFIHLPALIR